MLDLEDYVITPNLFSHHKLVLQHKMKTEQNIALSKLSKKEVLEAINPNASLRIPIAPSVPASNLRKLEKGFND
ncbi:MAG: hypothetical protein ACPGYF_04870 [Chitinophagales bacterium]